MSVNSEESQLEAAIQASLKDAQKKQHLVFSDDSDIDCVSVSSSSNGDIGDVEYIGNSLGGTSTDTRLLDVEYCGISNSALTNGVGGSRKRLSQRDDNEMCDELPRKMMRADISEMVESDGPSTSETAASSDVHLVLFRLPDGERIQQKFVSSYPIKVMAGRYVISN